MQGAFVFRGRPQAVSTLAAGLEEAARKALGDAAKEVFEKCAEAPVQAESGLAERFLKTGHLDQIESRNDPLGLVGSNGQVKTGHAALTSVLDHLNQTRARRGSRATRPLLSCPLWLVERHSPLSRRGLACWRRGEAPSERRGHQGARSDRDRCPEK